MEPAEIKARDCKFPVFESAIKFYPAESYSSDMFPIEFCKGVVALNGLHRKGFPVSGSDLQGTGIQAAETDSADLA